MPLIDDLERDPVRYFIRLEFRDGSYVDKQAVTMLGVHKAVAMAVGNLFRSDSRAWVWNVIVLESEPCHLIVGDDVLDLRETGDL